MFSSCSARLICCPSCLQFLLPVRCGPPPPRPRWLWDSLLRPHPTPAPPPPPPPARWPLLAAACPAPVLPLRVGGSLCLAANWPSLCAGELSTPNTRTWCRKQNDAWLWLRLFFPPLRSLPAPRTYSGAGENWREGCYWKEPAGGTPIKLNQHAEGRRHNMALYLPGYLFQSEERLCPPKIYQNIKIIKGESVSWTSHRVPLCVQLWGGGSGMSCSLARKMPKNQPDSSWASRGRTTCLGLTCNPTSDSPTHFMSQLSSRPRLLFSASLRLKCCLAFLSLRSAFDRFVWVVVMTTPCREICPVMLKSHACLANSESTCAWEWGWWHFFPPVNSARMYAQSLFLK